ncbi:MULTISPECIES: S10 family peptidase [Chelativorans]|jgi:carboxypeptidase C (cathepsin A)|uniref:Peptidase S10, serine carboxypeptidase n=1 Tax=Chelativorans sp. (strain BNC1) TaxID=266779 RepID=Q11GW4_CHESB|nr:MULTISPECIES: peptidase S10 [Chelativorans]
MFIDFKRLLSAAALVLLISTQSLHAQEEAEPSSQQTSEQEERPAEASSENKQSRLPEARRTLHRLQIDGEELPFQATAGAITLTGTNDRPEAEIAFVSYTKEGADKANRPVTFAINGGPGAASAYLHLGAIGPWLLPMSGERIVPSQSIALVENPDTWLSFTDLVFIDPAGTGFSRLIDPTDRLRERYYSVRGDVDALARFIRQWLVENDRLVSPKYFVGESYGGFRGPRVAEALQTRYGVALKGLTLVSPVLDFGWFDQPDYSPLAKASYLPSLVAAALERRGAFSEAAQREAEAYAAGPFVTDLLRGTQDEAAKARIVGRVAELTGVSPDALRDFEGRIDMEVLTRELLRDGGRIASFYDTTIVADAPDHGSILENGPEPVLDAMLAPITSAMLNHYRQNLQWLPQRPYHLLARNLDWEWGEGKEQPEAVSALRNVLALDPEFRVLVVHGYTDLVTPYFGTELILRQLRPFEPLGRVLRKNYEGGHMFYTRADSRHALRQDAFQLYSGQ